MKIMASGEGTALWCAVYFGLPESLSAAARHVFHPVTLLRSYGEALSHAPFVWLCLSMAFAGGGFLLYVATAPDVAINILGLGPTQFGWLFIPIVSGLILGSATSSKVAGHISSERMIRYGFAFMIFGAAANLLSNLFLPQRIPWAMLPLTFYTFGCSLIAPIFTIRCLDLIPHRRGLASSLQGFSQIVVFALISAVVPPFVYRSGIKHALGFAILLTLSGIAYWGFICALRKRPAQGTL